MLLGGVQMSQSSDLVSEIDTALKHFDYLTTGMFYYVGKMRLLSHFFSGDLLDILFSC